VPSGTTVGTSHLGGRMLAVSATTKHPEEAWKLVQFLNSPSIFTGAYKNGVGRNQRREWNWVLGIVMLLVTLFTILATARIPWRLILAAAATPFLFSLIFVLAHLRGDWDELLVLFMRPMVASFTAMPAALWIFFREAPDLGREARPAGARRESG